MSETNPQSRMWNTFNVFGESFELPETYSVVDYLGSGAYGCVAAANYTEHGESRVSRVVAIKKCKNIFSSRTLAKRTLREMRLLRVLSNHPNIIKLMLVLLPRYTTTFNSLYLVFEMMETDLASIIRSTQLLTDDHVRYFSVQLLRACDFLHQNHIVHRDIKPRNILVNGDCTLRLADFGLGRIHNPDDDSCTVPMTSYVTTRWYRAPEILVGWEHYDASIDMWAVGCVLAELVGRVPMFPGNDSKKQLELIVNVLGRPSDDFITQIRKPACREMLVAIPKSDAFARKAINSVLGKTSSAKSALNAVEATPGPSGVSPEALKLIDNLLVYDPHYRPTAKQCLCSPYYQVMEQVYLDKNGVQREGPVDALSNGSIDFGFEHRKLTIDELRIELLREARVYVQPHSEFNDTLIAAELEACKPSSAQEVSESILTSTSHASDLQDNPNVQEQQRLEKTSMRDMFHIHLPHIYCGGRICGDSERVRICEENAEIDVDETNPKADCTGIDNVDGVRGKQKAQAWSGCVVL